MKCNGNSRLQKAKLLEMTVEYLENLPKQGITQLLQKYIRLNVTLYIQ